MVGITVCELIISDGTVVRLNPNDIVIVVGPNNSGKSALLRAIKQKFESRDEYNPVVSSVKFRREGEVNDVWDWVKEWALTRSPDIMFTHCGGKSRVPMVVRALREVGVSVAAVVDFDIFSKEEDFKAVTDAAGIEWGNIERNYKVMSSAISGLKAEINTADVKREIAEALSGVTSLVLPKEAREKISGSLRRSTPWAYAKKTGASFVPRGDPSRACLELLSYLKQHDIFVVEVGELEGFDRAKSSHGPAWVNDVLSEPLDALTEAMSFVRQMCRLS